MYGLVDFLLCVVYVAVLAVGAFLIIPVWLTGLALLVLLVVTLAYKSYKPAEKIEYDNEKSRRIDAMIRQVEAMQEKTIHLKQRTG